MTDIVARIDNISALAEVIRKLPTIAPPVKHYFSDGVYAREIFMPETTIIVGKVHKTRHLNIVSSGICSVVTPIREFTVDASKFPVTFESYAGEQKVVYMHTEVVWTTIHLTNSKNVSDIEKEVIAESFDESLISGLVEKLAGVLQ